MVLDTAFDFASDSPHSWDSFWENNSGMGGGGSDPDTSSKTLKKYHQVLWSKKLPNGDFMDLKVCRAPDYLEWRDFRFGSDSIIVSFMHWNCNDLQYCLLYHSNSNNVIEAHLKALQAAVHSFLSPTNLPSANRSSFKNLQPSSI